MAHERGATPPAAIYVWLVRSEEVQEQPGSWRIRKWDVTPFPEANFTLPHAAVLAGHEIDGSYSAKVERFVNDTRLRDGDCAGYESTLLSMLRLMAKEADELEQRRSAVAVKDPSTMPWKVPVRYDEAKGYIIDANGAYVCVTRSARSDEYNHEIAKALNAYASVSPQTTGTPEGGGSTSAGALAIGTPLGSPATQTQAAPSLAAGDGFSNEQSVGIITADPITTHEQLEAAYQRAIRGRHISEIEPILALRNAALEALVPTSATGTVPAELLFEAASLALVISGHFCENPDEWLRGHEKRLRELEKIARGVLPVSTVATSLVKHHADRLRQVAESAVKNVWAAEACRNTADFLESTVSATAKPDPDLCPKCGLFKRGPDVSGDACPGHPDLCPIHGTERDSSYGCKVCDPTWP